MLRISCHVVMCLGLLAATPVSAAGLSRGLFGTAPLAPVIRHDAIERMPNNRFPKVEADIESEAGIQSAKLYFRSAQYTDFYYVEMTPTEDRRTFAAVLPIPERQTDVVYYIEAVDIAYDAIRTRRYKATTTDDPVEASFTGDDPEIVVGKVSKASPDMPPGFRTTAIVGIIGATGAVIATTTAGGGAAAGVGAATVAAIGAAAAGAATVGVLASQEQSTSNGSNEQEPLTVCFDFNTEQASGRITTVPGMTSIEDGQRIELDGRCSTPDDIDYRWDLGDGRTKNGPNVRPIFPKPGSPPLERAVTFDITLTVSDGSDFVRSAPLRLTVRPRRGPGRPGGGGGGDPRNEPPLACFETDPDPPEIEEGESIRLDARCSLADRSGGGTDEITSYEWDLGDGRSKDGPFIIPIYPEPGVFTVTLTVTDSSGAQDSTSEEVIVSQEPIDLSIDSIEFESTPLTVFEDFELVISVRNSGSDVEATLKGRLVGALDLSDADFGNATQQAACSLNRSAQTFECTGTSSGFQTLRIVEIFPTSPGTVTASATISSDAPDPNPSNNSASRSVSVGASAADISVDVDAIPTVIPSGGSFDLVITVRNLGPQTATDVEMTAVANPDFLVKNEEARSKPPSIPCTFGPISQRATCTAASLASGAGFTVTMTLVHSPESGAGGTTSHEAIVSSASPPDPDLTNNVDSVTVTVMSDPDLESVTFQSDTAFTSQLEVPPGGGAVQARVRLNETRVDSTNSSSPFRHQFRGQSGKNTIEGRLVGRLEGEGRWRFDFAGANRFVAGSIQVGEGQVLAISGTSVVFRLSGASGGERIRFTYRLSQ